MQTLANQAGQPFANGSIDPEGLAIAEDGSLFLSSEGDANALIAPFVGTFAAYGTQTGSLPVGADYLPTADQSSGIRNNLAFEALTLSPNGERLFVGTENALFQDGPAADVYTGSPSRVVEYDTASGRPVREYTYRTEPVQDAPSPASAFANNGLVELLALDDRGTLLALERSIEGLADPEAARRIRMDVIVLCHKPAQLRDVAEQIVVMNDGAYGSEIHKLRSIGLADDGAGRGAAARQLGHVRVQLRAGLLA